MAKVRLVLDSASGRMAPQRHGETISGDRQLTFHPNADTEGAAGGRITTPGETDMLKKAVVPLLGLLIVVMAGCASMESASSKMPPADVNGTWTGGTSTGSATYTLMLKQDGTRVTGTLSGAGTVDGPVEGAVDGNTIRLREQDGSLGTPALMVKGDVITGFVRGTTLTLRRVR
jgi:hypothetical protein